MIATLRPTAWTREFETELSNFEFEVLRPRARRREGRLEIRLALLRAIGTLGSEFEIHTESESGRVDWAKASASQAMRLRSSSSRTRIRDFVEAGEYPD